MEEELNKILNPLEVDNEIIPIEHLRYSGSSKKYVVWTMLPEEPGLIGNDECLCSVSQVDIDVYSVENYLNISNRIKEIMIQNNWIWTGDSEEMFEEDTKFYHRTSTFEKERII
ncbi:MAG: hypothetical protein MR405_05905 [Mollicutes bacterium]|nr:hypothetical protein [Mollicutes bacterium]MCI7084295.1 hypothetical protein [Mycoplasmatota bacterium]